MPSHHRHQPPLTAAELAEIHDQNPTAVVLKLLWEIHRLRETILRTSNSHDDRIAGRKRQYSGWHVATV